MPWRCPACLTTVQHTEELPREGVVYRCYICRLDLAGDPGTGFLRLAPLAEEKSGDGAEETREKKPRHWHTVRNKRP